MKIQRFSYKNHADHMALRKELMGKGNRDLFRLGASSVATVYSNGEKIGLNEYTSPTVFYYECCDFYEKYDRPSLEMTRGTIQESVIFNQYWKYFDPEHPTDEAYLENFHGPQTKFRKARKSNRIFLNPDYPWLYASPDYEITPGGLPLELKSPSSRAMNKYEAEIATYAVIQNHVQMLVMNKPNGELFAVVDGTYPKLYQFNRNDGIEKNIIDSTKHFHEIVLAGKKIVYGRGSQLQKEQALGKLAPPDDGNPLYTDYLKEKHKPENAKSTVQGDGEQLNLVVSYLLQKQRIKEDDKSLLQKENKIREFFTDKSVGKVEWEGTGYVQWIEKLTFSKDILKNLTGEP